MKTLIKNTNVPASELHSLLKECKKEIKDNRKEILIHRRDEDYARAYHLYSVNQAIEYFADQLESIIENNELRQQHV